MNKGCRKCHVRGDDVPQIRCREPRSANGCYFGRVDLERIVEDILLLVEDVVCRVRRVIKELLGQEWKILCTKDVTIVKACKEYETSQITNQTIG